MRFGAKTPGAWPFSYTDTQFVLNIQMSLDHASTQVER